MLFFDYWQNTSADEWGVVQSVWSQQFKQKQHSKSRPMNLIALKNFKSYENQLVNNLSPHINVILGKNGDGKSNFFKAINFVLTDKIYHNKTEYNTHVHRSVNSEPELMAVEIFYRNQTKKDGSDANFYKIERIWRPDDTEELRIDEKPFSKVQFERFLQSLGLNYSNSYNIIQQGKIIQVAGMDQYEIYKLLKQATGVQKFQLRHEQASNEIKKIDQNKQLIKKTLSELQSRLNSFEYRREEFEYYNFEQLATKVRSKQEYEEDLKRFNQQIIEFKKKEEYNSEIVMKLKINVKKNKENLELISTEMAVNQKQLNQCADDSGLINEFEGKNQTQNEKNLIANLKKLKKNREGLKAEFLKKNKEVENVRNENKPFKDKYDALTSQIQAEKLSKEGKDKGKQQIKQSIDRYRQNIKDIETELKRLAKHQSQFKIQGIEKEQEEYNSLKGKLEAIHSELKSHKIKYFEANRHKNQYESELEISSRQMDNYYVKVRKILPFLDFNLLNEIKKEKIEGVYGYMIEFVEIQPSVAFAYEIASLHKLCTLLVADEAAASKVVQVNKRLKGKKIQIYPLNFAMKHAVQKKVYPTVDDCYSLLNQQWIKIKPNHGYSKDFQKAINRIILNTFNRHVLVKDYDLGISISKEYRLNCITADREIVYSQGYLCKVGKDVNVDDRIEVYLKYAQKAAQSDEARINLEKITKEITKLQNEQMEIMRKKYKYESEIHVIELKLQEINEQKRSLDRLAAQQKTLLQKKRKLEQDLKKKEEILANVDNKKSIKVNMKQYKQLQETYNAKMKNFNKICEEEGELETKLNQLSKEEEELNQQLAEIQKQIASKKQNKNNISFDKDYRVQMEKAMNNLNEKNKELQAQIARNQQQIAQREVQNQQCIGTISLLQQQMLLCETKLSQIGNLQVTLEQIEQKSNSFSMSRNRFLQDRKNQVEMITTREKLMFSKLNSIAKQYEEEIKKFKELEKNQAKLVELLEKYDREKQTCFNEIFIIFQKEFDRIFRFITKSGKSDVRFKKIADKARGFVRYKHSISIDVSFTGKDEAIKWTDFSGGQKTVIAFCILMALQRCEPAPFYILDEIDAALDQAYLQKIVELIQQQSSKSQYFITSFKKEMMNFPQSICNYFFVESLDRVSSIRRVGQSTALQVVERIAN